MPPREFKSYAATHRLRDDGAVFEIERIEQCRDVVGERSDVVPPQVGRDRPAMNEENRRSVRGTRFEDANAESVGEPAGV